MNSKFHEQMSHLPNTDSENNQNSKMQESPNKTVGITEKFKTGCCSLYINLNQDQERNLLEVFLNLGKGGGCAAQSEAIARLVSLCLRCSVVPFKIVHQLQGIRCPAVYIAQKKGGAVDALSCPDAVARAISNLIYRNQEITCERNLLNEIPENERSIKLNGLQLQIW